MASFPSCYQHPSDAARGTCTRCLRPVCGVCSLFEGGHEMCPPCVAQVRKSKSRTRAVVSSLALLALAAGATWWIQHRRGRLAAGEGEATFDYGKHAAKVDGLRKRLAAEPCDRRAIVDYGDTLVQAGDFRGALRASDSFFQKCGEHPRLLWVTYSAHKSLSDFDAAAKDATALIERDPDDKDYWWWRGQAYESHGDLEKAAADYRQSISLVPRLKGVPLNLAALHERLGRPCEALFTLQQYAANYPELRSTPAFAQRLERLDAAGRCETLAGEGRATVRWQPGTKTFEAEVRINGGKPGRFVIDTGASFVTFSRAFAQRAGITATEGARITVATAGGLRTVQLTQVDSVRLQGAQAHSIQAAVADDLPENSFDGLLGMSFLERFEVRADARNGVLELTPHTVRTPTR